MRPQKISKFVSVYGKQCYPNKSSVDRVDGFSSIYMHMTHYVVSAGQTVSQGQLIGYVGNTGLSTGPHLHFGISYAGTYVNPLAYIY